MPRTIRRDEVAALLSTGIFDELIGVVENEWLECKGQPYRLEDDYGKQELAKDISGLANTEGGIILVGVRTEKNPTHFADEIREIRPFQQALVNLNQYHDILQRWIYPTLEGIQIQWFPSDADRERGVVAILIPSQARARQPFLVTKTVDDRGKRVEVVFGYVERRRANVIPRSVQDLHALLRDGLRVDPFEQRLASIQETLLRLLGERAHEAPGLRARLDERVEDAVEAMVLRDKPVFVIAAIPTEPVTLPTLFAARDAEIVRLLREPPELRPAGFDLRTDGVARIVQGQLRRGVIPGYKILDLWRDGALVFGAAGDGNFLAHAMTEGNGPLRINQLVLIESTYLFAELSSQVFEHTQPRAGEIEYRMELRNMTMGGTACTLTPGPLPRVPFGYAGSHLHQAPDSGRVFSLRWPGDGIHPGAVAFGLVSEVYTWFGLEHEHIPYTHREQDRLVICPVKVQAAGR